MAISTLLRPTRKVDLKNLRDEAVAARNEAVPAAQAAQESQLAAEEARDEAVPAATTATEARDEAVEARDDIYGYLLSTSSAIIYLQNLHAEELLP